jgi:hypothetical protein
MKYILLLVFIFAYSSSFADSSGYGCRIDDKVYTEYLGEAYPYGESNPKSKYYKSVGSYIPIYYGHGYNQHQGYKCGFINIYPSSSYWNGSEEVPIPAENEITSNSFNACVTAPSLNGAVVRNGDYVGYTYNNTSKCNPTGVPLDDYMSIILIPFGLISAYLIRKSLASQS